MLPSFNRNKLTPIKHLRRAAFTKKNKYKQIKNLLKLFKDNT